eukprot:377469-Pelagomonas_calceolata.AAC.2
MCDMSGAAWLQLKSVPAICQQAMCTGNMCFPSTRSFDQSCKRSFACLAPGCLLRRPAGRTMTTNCLQSRPRTPAQQGWCPVEERQRHQSSVTQWMTHRGQATSDSCHTHSLCSTQMIHRGVNDPQRPSNK